MDLPKRKRKQSAVERELEEGSGKRTRDLTGLAATFVFAISIAMCLFHTYAASPWALLRPMWQSSWHIMFIAAVGFLLYPISKKAKGSKFWFASDIVLTAIFAGAMLYIIVFYHDIQMRPANPTIMDVAVGVAMILCILEMGRRTMGPALSIITIMFLAYAFLGPYMPRALRHGGFDFDYFVQYISMSTEAVFGAPIGTTSKYIFMYMLFGSLVVASGCGKFIMDIACALTGRSRGGPAKMSVISSAAFGSISGSAIANVVTTGSFTIPMMKKLGYPPHYAGAVEAVASTGGIIMPPIMGAAAFIMAEMMGVSYFAVVKAALIPAILYYFAVLLMVHLQAVRQGIVGLSAGEIPKARTVLKEDGYLIIPLLALIFMMVFLRMSPMLCAFYSVFVVVIVAAFKKKSRMGIKTICKAFENTTRAAATLIPGVAMAGIISGCITVTGLAGRISGLITMVAGDSTILLLIMTMLASLVLGMGVTAAVAYIIPAVLVVPILISYGIEPMAANMFIFYFAVISYITPPVALASFAAAGVAQANMWQTGIRAFMLGITGFIVPYMIIFTPGLIMMGSPFTILQNVCTAIIGVTLLSVAMEGWGLRKTFWWERIAALAAATLLIDGGGITDIIGLSLGAFVFLSQKFLGKNMDDGDNGGLKEEELSTV